MPLPLLATVLVLARNTEQQSAIQFTSGLTWFQIEAVCQLPVTTGLAWIRRARNTAGDCERGEHWSLLGRHGTSGALGRRYGADEERLLPVAAPSHCWEWRQQNVSNNRAPAALIFRPESCLLINDAVCSGTRNIRIGLIRNEIPLLNKP